MSTVPPAVNVQAARQDLHKISAYIKAHETLIIIVLFAALGLHFYNAGLGAWATYVKGKDTLAHESLQAQNATNAAVAATNERAAENYKQLAEKLAEANAELASEKASQEAATKQQISVDRTLTSPELAAHWEQLADIPVGSVTPAVDSFTVTKDGGLSTVLALEAAKGSDALLKDEEKLADNKQTEIENLSDLNRGLHTQIDGLNAAATKAASACEDDKKQLRAQNRKRNLKYLIAGGVIVEGIKLYFFHKL